ncbi:elongation factor P 5-aminopentanone reductase [Alicyclobacillus sp. SP_1]|uniref:elongation factor P 5-aminopentanone reductase n=1 Tax=Alicyclobacillus sp. SP_1 TaxID=2942475 RepID=UPI002157B4B6|nr:SDR family oxidoreductase [Alicyclobacillus sp. SP_1]
MSINNHRNRVRELAGQTAIVTGSSRGIGAALAVALAGAGANVVVNYRQSAALAEQVVNACRNLDVSSVAVEADVSRESDVQTLMQAADGLGGAQILVNNAGVGLTKLLIDTTSTEFQEVLAHNLTSCFLCSRAVLPTMMQRGYGRIINMSSVWGLSGGSMEVAYSAAKGAVLAMTKALAKEVAKSGVTVNAIAPGAISTEMLSPLDAQDISQLTDEIPVGRLGDTADVVSACLYLASPQSGYTTGQILSPNGGLYT